ncbi:hypothetical protein [Pseudomonas citronellolis]|uniref:hypothetical protein n=1 Tax=Pseudomonas citronellolis TaxID=53408 RepID=UPI003899A72E
MKRLRQWRSTRGVLLAGILGLSGCMAVQDVILGNYSYDPTRSKAANITDAGKMTVLKDAEVPPALRPFIDGTGLDWGAIDGAQAWPNYAMLDLTPLLIGMGYGFHVENYQRDAILAWVPSELAATPQEAQRKLVDTITRGFTEAFDRAGMRYVDRGTYESDGEIFGIGDPNINKVILFESHEMGCDLAGAPLVEENFKRLCSISFSVHKAAGLYPTPDFLHANPSGQSYLFSNWGDFDGNRVRVNLSLTAGDSGIKPRKMQVLQRVSAELPEWVAIYVAQDERNGTPRVLFSQGRSMFFVR